MYPSAIAILTNDIKEIFMPFSNLVIVGAVTPVICCNLVRDTHSQDFAALLALTTKQLQNKVFQFLQSNLFKAKC